MRASTSVGLSWASALVFTLACAPESQVEGLQGEVWPALDGCNHCEQVGEDFGMTLAICSTSMRAGERCYEAFIFDADPARAGLQFECIAGVDDAPVLPVAPCEGDPGAPALPGGEVQCWYAREAVAHDGCNPDTENLVVGVLPLDPDGPYVEMRCEGISPTNEMLCSAGPPQGESTGP